jgi:archaellum component FlaC
MNAVMHKYDMTEGADMPANEDNNLAVQVAELRSDVRHIQSDVTDLKADFRVFRKETGERFEKVDQKFDSIEKEIGEVKDILASAKIWALGLYFTLAGSLLYVVARAAKWF